MFRQLGALKPAVSRSGSVSYRQRNKNREVPLPAAKRKVVHLKYDDKSAAMLGRCRWYLKEAKKFLDGSRTDLPDPSGIVDARFPQTSILMARHTGEDKFGRGTPFIAAFVQDTEQPEKRWPEIYFDPWYFVIVLLLELAGGRFRFDLSKGKYRYLAYAGPESTEGNHYLRRIIANTPSGADTRQRGVDGSRADYRRVTLKKARKASIRQRGQETRKTSRVREDAIKFAVDVFKRQLKGRGKTTPPVLHLNPDKYEQLLREAFDIADRMHEKLSSQQNSLRERQYSQGVLRGQG
jgi:hypothetical protein